MVAPGSPASTVTIKLHITATRNKRKWKLNPRSTSAVIVTPFLKVVEHSKVLSLEYNRASPHPHAPITAEEPILLIKYPCQLLSIFAHKKTPPVNCGWGGYLPALLQTLVTIYSSQLFGGGYSHCGSGVNEGVDCSTA